MFVDGYTYERSAIQGWIDKGKDTSPMTSIPLKTKQLIPNRSLKMLIQNYLDSGKGWCVVNHVQGPNVQFVERLCHRQFQLLYIVIHICIEINLNLCKICYLTLITLWKMKVKFVILSFVKFEFGKMSEICYSSFYD